MKANRLSKIAAYKGEEVWGIKDTGAVVQLLDGKELVRTDHGTASKIAIGADGAVWITCREALRSKGNHLMYFDYISGKFVVENKAHFLCKDVAVLPNGSPVIVTENGDLFILMKVMQQHPQAVSMPELVRITNEQDIHMQSIGVASGVPSEASLDDMVIWGVSD